MKKLLYNIFKPNYYTNFLKEIEIKNEIIENTNFTIQIVQNRINEINLSCSYNISFNELNISNHSKKEYNTDEIKDYIRQYTSFSITLNNISNYTINKNPKISIIIPVFNSQDFILNLHKSIQDQYLKDIEIIYVDDNSTDNSTQIIYDLQKKDNRIILLKNKKNKSQFYSRNKGAIFARGEYIQFIDSDDIIVGNILEKAYIRAKTENIDIIQYNFLKRNKENQFSLFTDKTHNNIIYQPELSDQMYYGRGFLKQVNFFIFNKIIKKEIYLKALIYMGDDILKENIYMNEDIIQIFSLLRVANSLFFIDDIGLTKISYEKRNSLLDYQQNSETANSIFHDNFIEIKFLYNKTKNNEHDKAIILEFIKMNRNLFPTLVYKITKGYELYEEVFHLLLNSEYFNEVGKNKIRDLKQKIMIHYPKI